MAFTVPTFYGRVPLEETLVASTSRRLDAGFNPTEHRSCCSKTLRRRIDIQKCPASRQEREAQHIKAEEDEEVHHPFFPGLGLGFASHVMRPLPVSLSD
jgi:hypothetical protein